jgi:hypothetical protein
MKSVQQLKCYFLLSLLFIYLFISGLTLPNGVLGHAGVTLTTKSIAHTPGSGKDYHLRGRTVSVCCTGKSAPLKFIAMCLLYFLPHTPFSPPPPPTLGVGSTFVIYINS